MIQIILAALVFAEILIQKPPAPADSGGISILSDTHGYDFGPYQNMVLNRVRMHCRQANARSGVERQGSRGSRFQRRAQWQCHGLRITSGLGLKP